MNQKILVSVILFIIIIYLLYTAYAIKREKLTGILLGAKYQLGDFEFKTPKWWTPVKKDKNRIIFKRTDTKYDWQGRFKVFKGPETNFSACISDLITRDNIEFDAETIITEKNILLNNQIFEFVRVEGTATKDQEKRLYLDIVGLRNKTSKNAIYLESYSSVLNGCLEGPFFEDVIDTIKLV